MIKNILWDFDGVILNSMKIKGDGFIELFKKHDKKYLKQIETYHYNNGGVSRFDKIRYFHEEIIYKKINEPDIKKLADEFANIIERKLYNKENLIIESVGFIKNNYQKYNFHIVSGAENNELNRLCDIFELSQYFITIEGSPTQKYNLVKNVIDKYKYRTKETILIGDAMTDYNAAIKNNIVFYGYNNLELKKLENYIDKFETFKI